MPGIERIMLINQLAYGLLEETLGRVKEESLLLTLECY